MDLKIHVITLLILAIVGIPVWCAADQPVISTLIVSDPTPVPSLYGILPAPDVSLTHSVRTIKTPETMITEGLYLEYIQKPSLQIEHQLQASIRSTIHLE